MNNIDNTVVQPFPTHRPSKFKPILKNIVLEVILLHFVLGLCDFKYTA